MSENKGTSMISKVKGKTEISPYLADDLPEEYEGVKGVEGAGVNYVTTFGGTFHFDR